MLRITPPYPTISPLRVLRTRFWAVVRSIAPWPEIEASILGTIFG